MSDENIQLGRRNALKIIASTAVAAPILGCSSGEPKTALAENTGKVAATKPEVARPLTDPDMNNPVIPWDFVLTKEELHTLKVLCDLIIPADEFSPGAGSLGAQDYINEHVSAPYDGNKRDLITVRGGVVWINSESRKRFGTVFADLNGQQQAAICDDIKWEKTAKPEFKAGAKFFARVRDLTATAFYTTEEGMADIGYVGNKPLASFEGPPLEVLKKLGLE